MISYLNDDLYKFSMKQGVWSNHPNAQVEYAFFNRSKDIDLLPYKDEIEKELQFLNGLGPTADEIKFLRGLGFLKSSYLDALSQFRLNTNHITVGEKDGKLDIRAKGSWYQTIDFEVFVLGVVNEVYFRHNSPIDATLEGNIRLTEKIERLKEIYAESKKEKNSHRHPFLLMEFGTRRAFSRSWQDHVVGRLADELPRKMFPGCSNVYLAMKYGLVPQGTMAHEWIMAFQAFSPLSLSQRDALNTWALEFRGKLGIALSDTLGSDSFFRDFDLLLAGAFTGARHDSGDPFEWGERLIAHYESLGIDPMTKTAAFTDSLDIEKAYQLWLRFSDRIRCVFGIGTFLTNDLGPKALSIVMKMVKCNGLPLVKISDEPGKLMCEDEPYAAWVQHAMKNVIPQQIALA